MAKWRNRSDTKACYMGEADNIPFRYSRIQTTDSFAHSLTHPLPHIWVPSHTPSVYCDNIWNGLLCVCAFIVICGPFEFISHRALNTLNRSSKSYGDRQSSQHTRHTVAYRYPNGIEMALCVWRTLFTHRRMIQHYYIIYMARQIAFCLYTMWLAGLCQSAVSAKPLYVRHFRFWLMISL